MRKAVGPTGLSALVAALALTVVSTSSALAATSPQRFGAKPIPQRDGVTLGASLDRSPVAPYRESARLTAIAAAHARAHSGPPHRVATPRKASKAATHRAVVRNHLWIGSLGISRSVGWFPCSRTTAPANYVYRWGCAGHDNVYLLGHAWGVFKALHDAYLNGTLRKGMVAIYADSRGRIHHYRLTAWQVVRPSDISWASSLRTPSMTLQTCIGPNSAYRLDVRLVSY